MQRKIQTQLQEDGVFCSLGPTSGTVYALDLEPREMDSEDLRELVVPPAQPDFDAPSPSRKVSSRKRPPLVHWVERIRGDVHRKAVRASDGASQADTYYISRAVCAGDLLLGKMNPRQQITFVAYEDTCYKLHRYEVLVVERGSVKWEQCRDGDSPPHALPSGLTLTGLPIYAVRVLCDGVFVPGQLISGEMKCRVPLRMREVKFSDYEVLTVIHDETGGEKMSVMQAKLLEMHKDRRLTF